MKTGYWSDPISFRDSVPFSATTVGRRGPKSYPIFSHSRFLCPTGSIPLPLFRTFQEASELPVSGQLDDATRARMRQPRCGLEDPFNQKTLKYLLLGED